MKFYCREKELNKMSKRYDGDAFECVIIYGRRRVGKTALIRAFCEGKNAIQFPALNSSAKENLSALSRAIYAYKNPEAENFPEYRTFDDAFAEITKLGTKERIIFAIDEYPYLAKSDSSISSKLQHLIDHEWQDSKIYLILCGSSMSFMQNQVLGYESPLYGRRTAQFKLEALDYKQTSVFNPTLTDEENAYVYGITGGIPHYINKLGVTKNLKKALLENFFDTSSYLFEEPGNLLKQELREPALYNSIITSIAEGSSKLNEIATKTGMETGILSKYLSVLMELGIVKKETPITENPGKRTVYAIDDLFFKFWYRFVPSNMGRIVSGRMENNYDSVIQKNMHQYMGLVFEKMCRQYLMCYADNLPFDLAEVGQWWGTDAVRHSEVQIDIVGIPSDSIETDKGKYILGSCKFKNEKIGVDELELLKYYASVFGKGKEYYYYIFSLTGFTQGLLNETKSGNVKLVNLKDMYCSI